MSTIIMAAIWPLQMPPTPKAVLVSLADNANDHGVCWPSITKIAQRTCFGRTAVMDAIRWLEGQGLLVADRSNGRHTKYLVKVPSKSLFEEAKPVRQADQSARATGTPSGLNQSASRTAPVRQADSNRKEPSITVNRATLRFNEFWDLYPIKNGAKKSREMWAGQGLDEKADQILADVRHRITADKRWQDGYIPNPTKYLEEERWLNGLPIIAPPAPTKRKRPTEDSETPLDRAIALANQHYAVDILDEAGRDEAITAARAKYAPEAVSA